MDIRTYIIILLLSLLLPVNICAGAVESYDSFYHEDTNGCEIYSVFRDQSTGVVWLGTSRGLMRYGNNAFSMSPCSMYPALLGKSIKTVQGIGNGNLLIYTFSKEYFILNPYTHEIFSDFDERMATLGLGDCQEWLTRISVGNDRMVWIYTGCRLYGYMPGVDDSARLMAEAESEITGICATDNRYYVMTRDGLSVYDRESQKLIEHSVLTFHPNSHNLKVAVDIDGNVWVGSEDLYRYNAATSCWIPVRSNLSVAEIATSRNGDVYVASSSGGILHYAHDSGEVCMITSDSFDPESLRSNRLRTIMIDEDNNLWVSYAKEGLSVSNYSFAGCRLRHIPQLKRPNLKDDIISLLYDRDGTLWLGTDGHGLYHTVGNPVRDKNSEYIRDKDFEDAVTCQYIDSQGRMWSGVYRKGVLCRDRDGVKMLLRGLTPFSITEDVYGNIYIGTLGDGIFRFSARGDSAPQNISGYARTYAMQLFCNRGNTIYAAMTTGLGIIDATTGRIDMLKGNRSGSQTFSPAEFQSVYVDSRGLIWLISSMGPNPLQVFDVKKDSILPIPGVENFGIKSMIEDDNKNMWFASDRGIVNIMVAYDAANDKYSFRRYVYSNRLSQEYHGRYNYRAVAKAPDGTIVFGSTDGFMPVIPALYDGYRNNTDHKVDFVMMKINNKYIEVGREYDGNVILINDIGTTESLRLGHENNNISLIFHTQDYVAPFVTPYYYRLNDSDAWTPIEGEAIELFNLSPGKYRLSVCGRNPDGTYTEPLTTLGINIASPWYMTTTAYISYAVLLLLIIAVGIFYFTERQRQKLRLQQAEKEMERQHQLNEVKLRFFTNISHDFRTPLTLIITPLEYYLSNKGNNPDVKFFTPIYKNAVRLLNLINQILDFRKLEVCGMALTRSNGNIVAFIKEVCSSFTIFAEDSDIKLEFSSDVPQLNMAFDKDKISKIMMNLLSNAFKHTQAGGKVYVRLNVEADRLRISVIDTGSGIPDEHKARIFDRFYQNKVDNAANMGCGIGLHIVKEFVTLHQGIVEVTDNIPSGAVFTVILPIIGAEPDNKLSAVDMSEQETCNDDFEEPVAEQTIRTLLLVEDNEEFLGFLAHSLEADYKILKAANGEEAMKIVENSDVDMLVSDVMMDGMDGLDLCRRIKTDLRYSHIPVILLTAKAMVEEEIRGFEVGADDYVTKPFNLSVLKFRIQNLLKDRDRSHVKFRDKAEIRPSEITITSLDERFLSQAISVVEENISDSEFSVEDLSAHMGLHRTHLYRKLLGITGKTPVEFIRIIRLKRACQYLEQSQMYISEIAYKVGFNSPKLFSKYFKMEFNISPKDYIKKNQQ